MLDIFTKINKKAIIGLATLTATAGIFGGVYFSKASYAVMLNDKQIGVVKDIEEVERILLDVEKDAETIIGKEVNLPQEITYNRILSSKDDITPVTNIKKEIEKTIGIEIEAYSINVDGKDIAYLKDKEDAEEILNRLESQYLKEEKQNNNEDQDEIKEVGFIEKIDIIKKDTKVTNIQELEEIYQYIVTGTDETKSYVVEQGDTVSEIAAAYDLSTADVAKANPSLDVDKLQIGQELNLTVPKPLVSVKTTEETIYEERIPYGVEYESSSKMYKGDSKVQTKGSEGKKKVVAEITKVNGIVEEKEIIEEEILKEPVTKVVLKGTKERPKTLAYGVFANPGGSRLTSRFGQRWGRQHKGIDIAMSTGTSVKAADGGKVIFSGWKSDYGKLVIIDHENGYKTYYGHNSSLKVKSGERVYRGQIIAKSGATGRVTGPHLHFEVRKNGTPVNPLKYVKY